MNKKMLTLAALLLAVLMAAGCVQIGGAPAATDAPQLTQAPTAAPTAAPTQAPTPAPTQAPTPVPAQQISGTLKAVSANSFSLQLANGTTIQFSMGSLVYAGLKAGDEVTVTYTGDVLGSPVATDILVTKQAPVATTTTASGTVMMVTGDTIYVQVNNSDAYGFSITNDTTYSFASGVASVPPVALGDTVTVTYTGNINNAPVATNIQVLVAVANRKTTNTSNSSSSDDLTNKHLSGTVTHLTGSRITIETDKGRSYTFHITSKTRETGSYRLRQGCRVRITYDGYASNSPDAKRINVLSNPDPSPTKTPSQNKKITGMVDSWGGMWMTLTNGFGCDTAYATRSGSGGIGDKVTITYYEKGGVAYATKLKFY